MMTLLGWPFGESRRRCDEAHIRLFLTERTYGCGTRVAVTLCRYSPEKYDIHIRISCDVDQSAVIGSLIGVPLGSLLDLLTTVFGVLYLLKTISD